jgi:hypothetical protein
MPLLRVSSTIRPAFIGYLDEYESVLQGIDPYEAVDENGNLKGTYFEDYWSSDATYGYADAPSPATILSINNPIEVLWVFDEEWLAKVRQVPFFCIVQHVFV